MNDYCKFDNLNRVNTFLKIYKILQLAQETKSK